MRKGFKPTPMPHLVFAEYGLPLPFLPQDKHQ